MIHIASYDMEHISWYASHNMNQIRVKNDLEIIQESFQNLGINENAREFFNPYGDEDYFSHQQDPVWETEIRSPADGGFNGTCPDRKSGDGLETPDDIEPRKNYFDSESDDDSGNEQYQVWKNVNNVFAGLNDTNRRISGHSISPYNSDNEQVL